MESAPRIELAAPTEDEVHVFHDRHKAERDRRVYIGMNRDVAFNPESAGAWQDAGDSANGHLWILSLRSATAYGVQVHFRGFQLPMGAKLFLYAPGHEESAQIFLGAGPYDDHDFWSTVFDGDEVRFELEVPDGIPSEKLFDVTEVGHLLVDPRATVGTWEVAGACNLDAACYPDWHNSAMSVARVLGNFDGLFACSGTLINNQSNDGTPYFLTADHCFGNDSIAHTATFYWHYANDVCNAGTPAYGPTTYGATLLATSPDYLYDSSLLLMDTPAPAENTYSGWSTSLVPIGTSLTSVHHPSASWRRIAFGKSITNTFVDFPDDIAVSWSDGITEPGSSGGPAFNSNHDIVGIVSRGRSSCTLPHGTDLMAPFAKAYPTLNDTGRHDYLVKGTADDAYTPNQTRATAANLSLPFSSSRLIVKPGKDDWFHVVVNAGEQVKVELPDLQTNAALEYYLGNEEQPHASGNLSYVYINSTGNSVDLFLHVLLAAGARYATYSLNLSYTNYQPPSPIQSAYGYVVDPYILQFSGQVLCEALPVDVWVEVSLSPDLSNAIKTSPNSNRNMTCGSFYWRGELEVQPETTYYWRAVAQNELGTVYSAVNSLVTGTPYVHGKWNYKILGFPAMEPGTNLSMGAYLAQDGNVLLSRGTVSITPPFTVTLNPSCCNFIVGIKSDVPGIYDGTLSVTVRGVTLSLPLHAEFLTALPHASWEPQDVDFGLILPQFTEPRTKVVTLTNDGGGPLTIYDSVWQVNFFTGFTTTNDCGSSLPSGHSCHFTVTLIPSGLGYYNNYLVLSSSNVQYTGFSVNARIFDVFQWGQRPARPSGNPPAISGGSGNGITAPQRPGRNERSIPSQDLPLAGLPLRSASSLLYPIVEADYLPVTKADRLRER